MSRRDWFAAAVITVVAVAIAAFLLRDGSDDPEPHSESDPPSARVMTGAAADELLSRLSQRGWSCFDSLRDPVVKRCFLDRLVGDGGTVGAEVALTYADGYVARVNIYAAGERDGGRHQAFADQAAQLAGDVLLDGAGPTLVEQLGDRREIEVAGRRVFGSRAPGSSVQVIVESASYGGQELPPGDFPPKAALVRAAEAAGLVCADSGASTTCGSTTASPSMTVTMSEASGRIGSLSISASNYAVPQDPVVTNMVAGYLFETGLGGPRAAAWVTAHASSAAPVRADLGGLHLRLGEGGDRAVYLSVGAIVN